MIRFIAYAWLVFALSGCKSCTSKPSRAAEHYGVDEPTIRLLDAGREPRRQLVYQPQALSREVVLSLRPSTGSPYGFPVKLTLDWRSSAPGSDLAHYEFAVRQALFDMGGRQGNPDVFEKVAHKNLQFGFESVRGYVAVAASDHVTSVQTSETPTSPSVPFLLHALLVPLPTEPVGPGARWEVIQPVDRPKIKGTGKSVYRLISTDGQALEIRMQQTRETKTESSRGPAVPVRAELVVHSHIRLSDLLPQSARGTITETVYFPGDGGPTPAMPMDFQLDPAPLPVRRR